MKLSELFTDESKWVQRMYAGYRATPTTLPIPVLASLKRPANCFCLSWGIRVIFPIDGSCIDCLSEPRQALRKSVLAAIFKLFPGRIRGSGIIDFNDHPDTTFADVQAVIKEVEAQ